MQYAATFHNGNLPSETLLNLLYDIEDMGTATGLEALTVEGPANATVDASRAATAVPASTANDKYDVTYHGIELATDPGAAETSASVSFSGFTLPDEEVLLLPVYFSGTLDENQVTVAFDGTPLETMLLIVQDIQGLPERPRPSSGGGGSAGFGALFLITMAGLWRRREEG